ncbi:MAG: hypothetical protein A4E35_02405 [Methanoregula sp. PtaU1.Bin051]|nr:MAG: hypothetical protein A4E35_02405 [Methanoregula sp. PtaU1.Bin051]
MSVLTVIRQYFSNPLNRQRMKKEITTGIVLSIPLIYLIYSIILNQKLLFLFDHLTLLISIAITIMFALIIFFNRSISRFEAKLFLFIIVIWVVFQAMTLAAIEIKYDNLRNGYFEQYQKKLNYQSSDQLNASWDIVSNYREGYVYYDSSYYTPNRFLTANELMIGLNSFFNPLLSIYYAGFNGINKLIVVQHTGRCGEFSDAISYLLNDITKLKTRSIMLKGVGVDHQFPEIQIGDTWFVFDKTYTTAIEPIKSVEYAAFLKRTDFPLYVNITNMTSTDHHPDIFKEHGFTPDSLKKG